MRITPVTLLLLILPLDLSAHHSRAEYVEEIELEGTLVDILWRNPHPGFTIEVEENGQIISWTLEGWSSLNGFTRVGITPDRFELGDTIKVFGRISERRAGRILSTHILLADGTEAVLMRQADPYWGESEHLGGKDRWETETQAAIVNASEENRGIFRVWSYPSPDMRTKYYWPLTESAQAARAEWDIVDNYATRCEPKGMPGSMITTNPFEFIDQGATIRVRGYELDIVRTVYMNNSMDPSAQSPSIQGFSVGHWENESTLVIHTSRINFPYLSTTGIPLSEAVEAIERYTLSEDQTRLDFHFSITDPETFAEPATYEYYWLALGEEFGQYECDVH